MHEKYKNAPNPQLPLPTLPQFLLFFLLLGWLVIAPVLVGIVTSVLPGSWPEPATTLLSTFLLSALLLVPGAGLVGLACWQGWTGLKPFTLALLATILYIIVDSFIRAVSTPGGSTEAILRLTALLAFALLIGGVGLLQAGVPRWVLSHAFGFDPPPVAGLLTALALVAIVTVGWPITGALGDSWTSQLLLLKGVAGSLPEEIFFRGAVLGIITFNFQHKKVMAALMSLIIYLAFTPSMIVPHNAWGSLLLIITAAPLAMLMIELRALTGSIWAGIIFTSFYRTAPLLFTDPRDELPLITQPWQTAAHFWMFVATGGLLIILWLGRQFLAPRWRLSRLPALAVALAITLFCWAVWAGLWWGVGYPGFYNDGFIIIMEEQADLSGAETIADPIARRELVRERLIKTAQRTQTPVRAALDAAGLKYRPFYISNIIRVEGNHRRMNEFSQLPGVDRVMLNPNVRPYPLKFNLPYGGDASLAGGMGDAEWNIEQVHAPEAWDLGVTGAGIVVAGQDTGYDWEHPALDQAYRGNHGTTVDHAFNWHDAWAGSSVPFDDDQHGTHTMGTILGKGEAGDKIGMAPDAQWIGCRNMRRGLGNPASYTDCMEFFLAPYPSGGNAFTDGNPAQAPHVINNSWGCPDTEGCDDNVLEPATAALRAAGIMMVVSAGNEGPGCQTVIEPPARYDNVFSVGATNNTGAITGFSSRGPVTEGAAALLKPDIAAPGAGIRSSIPGGGFGNADGTSMAGPHVTGLVALMWSANPKLIGQIDATEDIIRQSATPTDVSATCSVDAASAGDGSYF